MEIKSILVVLVIELAKVDVDRVMGKVTREIVQPVGVEVKFNFNQTYSILKY